MALFTSYLSFFRGKRIVDILPDELKSVVPIYVMRNRGNGAVEPPEMVLRLFKEDAITWEGYRDAYLDSLNDMRARYRMMAIANLANQSHVVLVCFEKNPDHCHRTLLAQEIARRFNVDFQGELDGS